MVAMLSSIALGAPVKYRAVLQPLNGSGVSGQLLFTLDGDRLDLTMMASGLAPSTAHPMQIRGFWATGQDAVLPPASAAGPDGVMTLEEAMPYVGVDRLL